MNLDALLKIDCLKKLLAVFAGIIIILGYLYIIIRNIRLRIKTINLSLFKDYQDRIGKVLS